MRTGLRTSAQTAITRAVHDHPGVTRAEVAAQIGIPSGFAAETVARLVAGRLVCEQPAPATGRRGRPTTSLHAHPDGPLVAVAAITQDSWQVAAVELGGTKVTATQHPHQRDQSLVLDAVAAEFRQLGGRFGTRVRAAAVAVPGTVAGSELVHAPGLGWHGVSLSALWPGGTFVAGYIVRKIGLIPSLLFGTVAGSASHLSLAWLAGTGQGDFLPFAFAVSIEGFAYSFAQVVLITYMSSLASTEFAASQYALLTSLCALPGSLLAGASGFIIARTGFENFFVGTSLIGIPVALLAWFVWRNHPPVVAEELNG